MYDLVNKIGATFTEGSSSHLQILYTCISVKSKMSLILTEIFRTIAIPLQTLLVVGYTAFMLSVLLILCFFPNILKTRRWIFITFCRHNDIIRKSKCKGPILLELLPSVKCLNAVKSLCTHCKLSNQWLEFFSKLVQIHVQHYDWGKI